MIYRVGERLICVATNGDYLLYGSRIELGEILEFIREDFRNGIRELFVINQQSIVWVVAASTMISAKDVTKLEKAVYGLL